MPPTTQLDMKKELSSIRDRYTATNKSTKFNALVYGDMGTGKTVSLATAPAPVLIHSFDPGGEQSIRRAIASGRVIVDSQFQQEDARKPTAWRAWEKEFDRLSNAGVFNQIGTFCIDSVTTMAEALMNSIMLARGHVRTGTVVPEMKEYLIQMNTLWDMLKLCTALPCNFIITAHTELAKDEASGKMIAGPMVTGKLTAKLPLLFDEIYVAQAKAAAGTDKVSYTFLTKTDGLFKARSRLSDNGQLATNTEQDFKKILKAADLPYEDKPLFI